MGTKEETIIREVVVIISIIIIGITTKEVREERIGIIIVGVLIIISIRWEEIVWDKAI